MEQERKEVAQMGKKTHYLYGEQIQPLFPLSPHSSGTTAPRSGTTACAVVPVCPVLKTETWSGRTAPSGTTVLSTAVLPLRSTRSEETEVVE